jgi:hypothetical protein
VKIEMGESLFYSWLRHVKQCQIVQTNWKVSSQWELKNRDRIEAFKNELNKCFDTDEYTLFKNNKIDQILKQTECDVLGINVTANKPKICTVDVAFHRDGLIYENKNTTVKKVIEKLARTAFCLYGYLGNDNAEIIFASPKVNDSVLKPLEKEIEKLNGIFKEKTEWDFTFRLIANKEFNSEVLNKVLKLDNKVADTSELFMRSYQMLKTCEKIENSKKSNRTKSAEN